MSNAIIRKKETLLQAQILLVKPDVEFILFININKPIYETAPYRSLRPYLGSISTQILSTKSVSSSSSK